MKPLVSIVVPCFNSEKLLEETLENVKKQTLKNWECLIIDDGSTDTTPEIGLRFSQSDSRFLYMRQKNKGLSAARNAGIRKASGKYIQLLDSDDLLSEKKLDLQTSFMERSPGVKISYTDAFYFDDSKPETRYKAFHIRTDKSVYFENEPWIPEFHIGDAGIVEHLLWSNIAPVNSMLIRRSVFTEVGYFDTSYKSLEDWEFWARSALKGLSICIYQHSLAFALVRVHTSSMTFDREKMTQFFTRLQLELLEKLKKKNDRGSRLLYNRDSSFIYRQARNMISEGGLFNPNSIRKLGKLLPWKTFILLYAKELNSYRKVYFGNKKKL